MEMITVFRFERYYFQNWYFQVVKFPHKKFCLGIRCKFIGGCWRVRMRITLIIALGKRRAVGTFEPKAVPQVPICAALTQPYWTTRRQDKPNHNPRVCHLILRALLSERSYIQIVWFAFIFLSRSLSWGMTSVFRYNFFRLMYGKFSYFNGCSSFILCFLLF